MFFGSNFWFTSGRLWLKREQSMSEFRECRIDTNRTCRMLDNIDLVGPAKACSLYLEVAHHSPEQHKQYHLAYNNSAHRVYRLRCFRHQQRRHLHICSPNSDQLLFAARCHWKDMMQNYFLYPRNLQAKEQETQRNVKMWHKSCFADRNISWEIFENILTIEEPIAKRKLRYAEFMN